MLPEVKKANTVGTMEAIENYLRLRHGVERAPLAYIVKKMMAVHPFAQIRYITPEDEMIVRMMHLPKAENLCLVKRE